MSTRYISDGTAGFSGDDLSKLLLAAQRLSLTPSEMVDWVTNATGVAVTAATPLTDSERRFFDANSGLNPHQPRRTGEAPAQQHARLQQTSLSTRDASERLGIGADAVRHRISKKQLWAFTLAGQRRIPDWQFMFADVPSVPEASSADGTPGADDARRELRQKAGLPTWEWLQAQRVASAKPLFLHLSFTDAEGNEVEQQRDIALPAGAWVTLPGLERVVAAVPDGVTPVALEGFMLTEQDELVINGRRPESPLRWLTAGRNPDVVAALVADLGAVW